MDPLISRQKDRRVLKLNKPVDARGAPEQRPERMHHADRHMGTVTWPFLSWSFSKSKGGINEVDNNTFSRESKEEGEHVHPRPSRWLDME